MQWIISNKIIFLEKKNQTSFDDCETSVLRPVQKKDWFKGFHLENIFSPFDGRIEQERMSKERELEVLIRKREEEELETIVGFWNKLSHQEISWNHHVTIINHHKAFMASEKNPTDSYFHELSTPGHHVHCSVIFLRYYLYGCSAQYINPNRWQTWVKHVGEQATKRFRFELKHLLQIKYERQEK